jgi:CubicO group peptidase (beta-lactamase class C family)
MTKTYLRYVTFVLMLTGCITPTPADKFNPATTPSLSTPNEFVWQSSTPEQQGMDSELLGNMLAAIHEEGLNLHSLLIVRNGYLVVEAYFYPFQRDTKHELYSCTKSFISTLIGIAIDQNLIEDVNRPVINTWFADRTFNHLDAQKESLTLEHLLTMTSGLDWSEGDPIYREMYYSNDWVQFVLDKSMVEEPGNQFNYCSGCSHILSAILQRSTGTGTLEFARQYLFEPLGINDFSWEMDSNNIPIGGWGLNLTPRDMTKLGLLYLNNGVWNGEQVVEAGWIRTSVSKHVETPGDLDYGYQWWIYPSLEAYTALGRDGQTIFVIPESRLVVVTTAEVNGHEEIFSMIGKFIVPAIRSTYALPSNPAGQAKLETLIEAVKNR